MERMVSENGTETNKVGTSMIEGLARISRKGLSGKLTDVEKAEFIEVLMGEESFKKTKFVLGGRINP